MRLQFFLSIIMRSIAFFTRLPVSKHWFLSENNPSLADEATFFPITGAIIGAIVGLVVILASYIGFSATITACIAMITLVMICGALHEDGLADVADSFFVNRNKEQRIVIMRDSRVGAYGSLALIFSIVLNIALLSDIIAQSNAITAAISLIITQSVSRGWIVYFWQSLPSAQTDGTAAKAGHPSKKTAYQSAILSIFILLVFGFPYFSLFALIASAFFSALAIFSFRKLCLNRIGGYTGDTLGAMQQIIVIIVLACLNLDI